ncbi:hypothetical protein ACF1DW_04195 [Streptomyces sp. NPDC014603]|uniref:hypothetical protein n=1 Tax=Streptomyces sp. NPDC014603 TaxID=3364873 RepID=UPI0036F8EB9C
MAQQRDALTQLVQQHVGTNTGAGKMTVVAFASKAIDPASGYRPSTGLIGKILQGASYRITPQLVGAIAAGLGLPREIVAAAAHFQLIGYEQGELDGGAPAQLLQRLGAEPGDAERALAEKWQSETGW